jgi:GPH family glycoside/pentoside/hexuronide:cation symporter
MSLMTPERSWLLFILLGALGLAFGGFITLPFSIIGDTIDYDEFNTGLRREGFYWGIAEFSRKLAQGAAFAGIGATLSALGYVEGAVSQSDLSLLGLKVLFVVVPVVLYCLAALLFWRYPLNKELHDQMHRQMGREVKDLSRPR